MASNEDLFELLRDLQDRVDNMRRELTQDIQSLHTKLDAKIAPIEDKVVRHEHHWGVVTRVLTWSIGGLSIAGVWQFLLGFPHH